MPWISASFELWYSITPQLLLELFKNKIRPVSKNHPVVLLHLLPSLSSLFLQFFSCTTSRMPLCFSQVVSLGSMLIFIYFIFGGNFGFCKQTGTYIMLAKLFKIIFILITLYEEILIFFLYFSYWIILIQIVNKI